MKPARYLFLHFALILAAVAVARAQNDGHTIKFSDPGKPGTLKVIMAHGGLRIQGADANEISVNSDVKAATRGPRKDGLRVLSSAASFSLTEKDNVVTLDTSDGMWRGGGNGDFRVSVPRSTSVVVQSAFGGDIHCNAIAGDIEINSMNGEIRLDDVSGGIVVGTMNGEIRANIRELHEGKPLSFTSMSGAVVIRVPENAKANVRLRTQNGSVLTDFDENVLVTKSESTPGVRRGRMSLVKGPNGKIIGPEVTDAIREAAQTSAAAMKEAFDAAREGVESARAESENARAAADKARRDAERARRDADRERSRADRAEEATPSTPATPVPPKPPAMPKIPVPPISGGKLVTGTLNGGGPEINVSTMNGDVTLRKLEAKK